MPEYIQEDLTAWKSVLVHFKNKEDMQAFAILIKQTVIQSTKYIWFPKSKVEGMMDKRWKSES